MTPNGPGPDKTYEHFQLVHLPFGKLGSVLAWCETTLQGKWTYSMVGMWGIVENPHRDLGETPYAFYFEKEVDCFAFSLRWLK